MGLILKEQIIDLIKKVNESYVFLHERRLKASFRCVVLPADYFIPDVHFSTKSALAPKQIEEALFCEIEVNGICVFREYRKLEDGDSISKWEDILLERLLVNLVISSLSNNYYILKRAYEKD